MGDDNMLTLTATLEEGGTVASGHISPDMRDDIRRGDVRLSLQNAALSVSAPAPSVSAPPPITLYTRPETAQKNQPTENALSDAFAATYDGPSQSDAAAHALTDYFHRWGQSRETAQNGDAVLSLLGKELGLTISNKNNIYTSQSQNNPQRADTIIAVQDEVALILEDVEDELDITQFDIY